MADLAGFKTRFPEFAAAGMSDPLLSAFLADMTLQVDATACGVMSDQIIYLKTARALALTPYGNTSTLVNKDGSTVYDDRLENAQLIAVGTIRAI